MKFLSGVACVIAGLSLSGTAFAQGLNKSEVEKIIEDYLMNNPEVIIQSVNDYQNRDRAEQQQKALSENNRKIFSDNMTPVGGNTNGDVTVVEFFDYNCGYCKSVHPNVEKLLETDKGVRFVYKEFPILGPTSELAAKWALAAHNQGKYEAFHGELMQGKGRISEDLLVDVATRLGLDVEKLRADAETPAIQSHIAENRALAQQLTITGTPGFIIGDQILPGAVPFDTMVSTIAEQRAEKSK